MKFYNRTEELNLLSMIEKQSTKTACFTVLLGRRRNGKTSLLLKSAKENKHLYLFVSRNSEAVLCKQFQQDAAQSLGLQIFGNIDKFRDLFEQLLVYATKTHYTLIIDEFQDFEKVNPAIFSEIQDLWDRYKNKIKINFIVCGSIYSMMTKIFEDKKEPLFGRLTSKITVHPLSIKVTKKILKDYNPHYTNEDLLFLYTISGCIPKYISSLMDGGATTFNKMLDFVTRADSPFITEGKDMLVSEFGKDYSTYFSILQLIASGYNKQSNIDSIIGKNTGAYIQNLETQYSLVKKQKPIFSRPESRNTSWIIDDNFLRFWFRFIYPNQSLIEMGRHDLLKKYVVKNYEQYSGRILENYFRKKISEEEEITDIGSYWDNKGENEIDIITVNDFNKSAMLAEVKRKKQKINLKILELKSASVSTSLNKYSITYKGLSTEDM
ncbi:MAG: ATP-binding protein [Bacteroidales bacterium]|jgi:AAA+ ATPase superfamily predicted ATPase|nr:ATP-binding protein [Bacteroidales bacterium]